MLAAGKLVTPCHFRADGVFCNAGLLYYSKEHDPAPREQLVAERGCNISSNGPCAIAVYYKPVLLENEHLTCSVCEGKGVILAEGGRELIAFLQTHGRPLLRELIQDIMEEQT